jgi:hypothetical protein
MFRTVEASLSDCVSIAIECSDCGHSRWAAPREMISAGISPLIKLNELGGKLYCSQCRDDGLAGKNVLIQAAFVNERTRLGAEAAVLARSHRVRASG